MPDNVIKAAEALKRIATESNVKVVVPSSELIRQKALRDIDASPSLSDIGSSSAIGNLSSIVFGIERHTSGKLIMVEVKSRKPKL